MSFSPADLEAYCARIGYDGPRAPTLATLHAIVAGHAAAIPFENLDVLLGRPIALDAGSLVEKLVHQRRGGYCFEQNGLLLLVLSSLGFSVAPLSGRVRWERPRDFTPPRTHLFVRDELAGASWLADVGVGGLSLTAAIQLNTAAEQPTPHEPRRIVREAGRLFHQVRIGAEWLDVCEFTLEEMPPIDRELANWYTSTHPDSRFRSRLVASRAGPNGQRLSILNQDFKIRSADGRSQTRALASPEELLAVLDEQFGLRFPPGTRFDRGVVPWSWSTPG
jgi:N-hydroxyarylamine O-acetyltransferase